MLLVSFLFAVAQSSQASPTHPVAPDAVARVKECGFASAQLQFNEVFNEDIVLVTGVSDATEAQLKCVAEASLATNFFVQFPAAVDAKYQPLYWTMNREQGRLAAKAWLQERGLLSQLPSYDPKLTDEATFVRRLESLCGPKASGMLRPHGGMAVITPDAVASGVAGDELLWCLTNVAAASGYGIGYVGNEAYKTGR